MLVYTLRGKSFLYWFVYLTMYLTNVLTVFGSIRQTEINPNLKEVNHKKVAPASADHNLSRPVEVNQIDSYSLKNGTTVQDISSEDMKKSTREIRYRYCCFMS